MSNETSHNSQPLDGIDIDRLITTLKSSWPFIMLIFVVINVVTYLTLRWTKPIYESSSQLKLDVEANAVEFGLTPLAGQSNTNVISGEIELLKSRLFFNRVLDSLDLNVSYYKTGNVLNDEKYSNAPFKIEYHIKDESIKDKRIYLEISDGSSYKLSFTGEDMTQANTHKFGKVIAHPKLDLKVSLTSHYNQSEDLKYFFQINSHTSQIYYLQKNLIVEPLNFEANTIKIAFRDFNRNKAVKLVNTIDSVYLQYTQEEKNLENRNKINWLNKELGNIEARLEGFEDYFEKFTIENRTSDLDADLKRTLVALTELDSQRYVLDKHGKAISESIKRVNNGDIANIISSNRQPQSKELIELNERLIELEQLKLSHSENTFVVESKSKEVNNLRKAVLKKLQNQQNDTNITLKEVNRKKTQLLDSFKTLPGKNTDYSKKQRFFKLFEEFYLSLMQSKAQYQIAQAGTITQFKILSPASIPAGPVSPNKLFIYGVGMVASLILSLVFVGIRYLLHNKITSIVELEKHLEIPILGSVPKAVDRYEETTLVVDKKPKSAISESLRTIRTNIEFMVSNENKRIISVTSTISGEGKTFIAANLGGIIAMSKKKTIILDLDMRKPRVHSAFGDEESTRGVSTILINQNSIEECIKNTSLDKLDYIPSGPNPPNPSELLLNGEFETLLEKLIAIYDVVILDTPPAGLVTDGVLAMKKAHLALYIVRANFSKRSFLNTVNRLKKANKFNNLSIILNAVSRTRGSYGYGYGGYGYYDEKTLKK